MKISSSAASVCRICRPAAIKPSTITFSAPGENPGADDLIAGKLDAAGKKPKINRIELTAAGKAVDEPGDVFSLICLFEWVARKGVKESRQDHG
ncbi:MAG TPA: hypothetical protein PK613_03355 [Anaerolineaceae bacterium]|nr:hypothetical protein [Anaerolineaceae bacterium]